MSALSCGASAGCRGGAVSALPDGRRDAADAAGGRDGGAAAVVARRTGAAFSAAGDPRVPGARRHGSGVQGAAEVAEPPGGAETAGAGAGGRSAIRGAVREGGPG